MLKIRFGHFIRNERPINSNVYTYIVYRRLKNKSHTSTNKQRTYLKYNVIYKLRVSVLVLM